MDRVTSTDRVTSEAEPEAGRVTSVVGKKALCTCLGWSRPALDRRLRWDKNFPVLHCGKPGEPWQFDLHAVVAHVDSSSACRGRPPRATGRTSGLTVLAISRALDHAQTIRRTIAELVSELGILLEGVDAALDLEGTPVEAATRGSLDGDAH